MSAVALSDEGLRELGIANAGLLTLANARIAGLLRPDEGPQVDVEQAMDVVAQARDRGVAPTLGEAFAQAIHLMTSWHDQHNDPQEGPR